MGKWFDVIGSKSQTGNQKQTIHIGVPASLGSLNFNLNIIGIIEEI